MWRRASSPCGAGALDDRPGLVWGVERNLVARAIRYRGTYDRAEQYLRGDVCTHDGCLFVAARDNPVDAPGVCPDWQLVGKERVQQARLTG